MENTYLAAQNYYTGTYGKQDKTHCYILLRSLHNKESFLQLAYMTSKGEGCLKNYKKALHILGKLERDADYYFLRGYFALFEERNVVGIIKIIYICETSIIFIYICEISITFRKIYILAIYI